MIDVQPFVRYNIFRKEDIMNKQEELLDKLNKADSLNTIQDYVNKVIEIRVGNNQSVEQKMLLLTEEVGELAKSIRKEKVNMLIDENKINNYDTIEGEVADVFIVLTSICNTLGINLFDAFYEKEKINVKRKWNIPKKD